MIPSASWSESQDIASLTHMEALLERMQSVLEQELSAVARFDVEAIVSLGSDKEELMLELQTATGKSASANSSENAAQSHAAAATNDSDEQAARRRVRNLAGQVRAMMRANSALMEEAIKAITAKLGIETGAQSYDRRARTVPSTRRSSYTSI